MWSPQVEPNKKGTWVQKNQNTWTASLDTYGSSLYLYFKRGKGLSLVLIIELIVYI